MIKIFIDTANKRPGGFAWKKRKAFIWFFVTSSSMEYIDIQNLMTLVCALFLDPLSWCLFDYDYDAYIWNRISIVSWHWSRGGGTWENGADKWDRLKFHAIDNFIHIIRQFILWRLRMAMRVKFSWVPTVYKHKGKLYMANPTFFHRSI